MSTRTNEETDETSDDPRDGIAVRVTDGEVVLYDEENPEAWIRSDLVIDEVQAR